MNNTNDKRKILIVDDEKLIRMTLSRIITSAGYEVETAEDGETAKKQINEKHYDLVITDLVMKSVGGIEVLHHVKEISPDTIVIVMTAYASMESSLEALRQGAYDYILKPCNNEEVLMRIQKGLEKKDIVEKLHESEKKLALSRLAVALNHEINSPLTAMIGNTEVLLMKKNDFSSEAYKLLENIIEAGNKIKEIVSKLRNIEDAPVIDYASNATMIDLKSPVPHPAIESKPTVLVADDEELILELFHTVLEDEYEVCSVLNGDELLQVVNQRISEGNRLDIFFLDLYMPGHNGLQIFRELKKINPEVKVCFITGYINDDLVKQAMEEGAIGYLYKPFKISDILEFIKKNVNQ